MNIFGRFASGWFSLHRGNRFADHLINLKLKVSQTKRLSANDFLLFLLEVTEFPLDFMPPTFFSVWTRCDIRLKIHTDHHGRGETLGKNSCK